MKNMSKYRLVITSAPAEGNDNSLVLYYEEGDDYDSFRDMATSFTENKLYCKDLVNQVDITAVVIRIEVKPDVGDGWHTVLSSLEFV